MDYFVVLYVEIPVICALSRIKDTLIHICKARTGGGRYPIEYHTNRNSCVWMDTIIDGWAQTTNFMCAIFHIFSINCPYPN